MIDLLNKLLPTMLFWILAATYLGGWAVELKGGRGPQQVIGLILSFILFVVVWELLHVAFLGVGPVLGGVVITSFIAAALLPAITWVAFKMVGVTVARSHGHAH